MSSKERGLDVSFYRDFVANTLVGVKLVQIQVGQPSPLYDNTKVNTILNELEIMKISSPTRSPNEPNPVHGNTHMNSKETMGRWDLLLDQLLEILLH